MDSSTAFCTTLRIAKVEFQGPRISLKIASSSPGKLKSAWTPKAAMNLIQPSNPTLLD
jgi:hypothetical protein